MTKIKRPRVVHHGRVTPGKGKLARKLGGVRRRALDAQQRTREEVARQIEDKGVSARCRFCSGETVVTDRGEGRGRRVTVRHTPTCKAAVPPRV